jgi:O-antigen/teichoic acid export membrane protein
MKIILDKLFSSGFLKSSLIVSVSKVISSLSNLVFMVYAVNIISKTENGYLQYYLGFLPVILAVAELGIPSAIVKYLSVEKTDLNKIGIGKLFTPGANTSDIADYIKTWVKENRSI